MDKLDLHFSRVCWIILTVLLVNYTTCKCLRIELTAWDGQGSKACIILRRQKLTNLSLQVFLKYSANKLYKNVRCQFFGRLGTQDRAAKHSQQPADSWISKISTLQMFLKSPLSPKIKSFREIHKVYFYLFLAWSALVLNVGQGCSGQPPLLGVSYESVNNTDSNAFWIKSWGAVSSNRTCCVR